MQTNFQEFAVDRPATYRIQVQGRLDSGWSQWFDGLALSIALDERGQAITTMTGTVADQMALHGLLERIRDLCLYLLLVQRLDEPADRQAGTGRG